MARLAPQPGATAMGAGLGGLVARQVLAHRDRIGLAVAPLEVRDDALERVRTLDAAGLAFGALRLVDKLDFIVARTIEQRFAGRRRQVLVRRFDVKAVMPRHALEHRMGVGIAPVPALDRTASQAQRRKRHHPVGVEHRLHAQSVAVRTSTHGRIEREQPGLELGQRIAAHRAGEFAGEQVFSTVTPWPLRVRPPSGRAADLGRPGIGGPIHLQRDRPAIGGAQRGLEALGQSLLHLGPGLQAVDHDVDVVLLVLFQLG